MGLSCVWPREPEQTTAVQSNCPVRFPHPPSLSHLNFPAGRDILARGTLEAQVPI